MMSVRPLPPVPRVKTLLEIVLKSMRDGFFRFLFYRLLETDLNSILY